VAGLRRFAALMRDSSEPPAPDPPVVLPPARTVVVPGRGEFFLRDSGGNGPPVLLIHGWLVSADLNWFRCYGPLAEAGYRVLALDLRGHGRGLRPFARFSLTECAADAAALVRELDCGPVTAVGYSMGGPVAALMARNHRETVAGLVLSATAQEWQDPDQIRFWKGMGLWGALLTLFPQRLWRAGLLAEGYPDSATTSWFATEMTRGRARDLADAGRELGRYDSRGWSPSLRTVPAAVVNTTRDRRVPPEKQRALAEALAAARVDVDGDHNVVTTEAERFVPGLLEALEIVGQQIGEGARAAA
jgi:3-oxoadipate enol-lactonase